MAAIDPLLGAFLDESDQLIAQRMPRAALIALAAIASLSLAACLSTGASLWSWLFYTFAESGVAIGLVAAAPVFGRLRWQRSAALSAGIILIGLLHAQLLAAKAPADVALVIALLVTAGAPLVLPWGAFVQAPFAIANGVASVALAVLSAGDTAHVGLVFLGVVLAGVLSIVNARQLELHRFALFCDALRRETGVSLDRRLLRVVERIDVALDDRASLDSVAEAAREALGREWVLIFLHDAKRKVLRVVGGSGHSDLRIESLRSLEIGLAEMPLLGEIISRGQVELANLNNGKIAVPPLLERWRCTSLLGAALLHGDRNVGVLLAGASRRARPLDGAGRHLFTEIARRTATAVSNLQLLNELRQAAEHKADFLATVSQELRTPLDVIVGYADMLRDSAFGELSPAQGDMLERLRAHSVNLAEFTAATLDTHRLESDEVGEPLRWLDLQSLVHEMRRDGRNLPRQDGVELEWDVVSKPLRLFTDPYRVRVIVRNLVGNALKFTDSGRVVACVHVDEARRRLEISVRDTGRGIEKTEIPGLFEMFRQGSNCAGDANLSGVGLGLYIVKSFAEQLDGSVGAHSEPGRGSIFRVSLPLQVDEDSQAARAGAQLVA